MIVNWHMLIVGVVGITIGVVRFVLHARSGGKDFGIKNWELALYVLCFLFVYGSIFRDWLNK